MPDREAWLASAMIELAGTPAGEFDEPAYASACARRLAELLRPAEILVLFCVGPGCPAVAAGSSERTAGLARLAAAGVAGPAADCCRTGRATGRAPLTAPAPPWPQFAAAACAAGFESVAALPMRHQDETVGAVTVLSGRGHPLEAAGLSLAELLGEAAAIGVLGQRSLRTARQLQQALDSRVVIEQAKGAVAAWLGITPGEAFELLRGYSRRSGRLLSAVAGDVVRGVLPARDLASPGKAGRRGAAGRQAPALAPRLDSTPSRKVRASPGSVACHG